MDISHIIEGLNLYYESFETRVKGHFIVLKTIDANPVIKSQKVYKAQVWFIRGKDKQLAFEETVTCRSVSDYDKESALGKLSSLLTKSLLDYISTQEFKKLCYGNNSDE